MQTTMPVRGSSPARPGPVVVPAAFNMAVLVASLWFFGGLLLDGWAHNHLDLSHESFFTPYHAVFYSGFAALAGTIFAAGYRSRVPGRPWFRSLPDAYVWMGVGIAIFAVGGALDMLWHIAFGIEQDTAALYSPTHLLLATGGAVMMCGPIKAGLEKRDAHAWRERSPELIALSLFATLITFFLMWAFGTGAASSADPHRAYPELRGSTLSDVRDLALQNGVTAVIFRSLVIAGVTGWAARGYRLPFGAIALLVVVPSTLIAVMLNPTLSYVTLVFTSALLAGIAGDVILRRLGGSDAFAEPSWRSRTFAFAVPFLFWSFTFFALNIAYGGFWWTPHVVYGAPVIGGLAGLLLALSGEATTAKLR